MVAGLTGEGYGSRRIEDVVVNDRTTNRLEEREADSVRTRSNYESSAENGLSRVSAGRSLLSTLL